MTNRHLDYDDMDSVFLALAHSYIPSSHFLCSPNSARQSQKTCNQASFKFLHSSTGTPPKPVSIVQIESSCRDKNEEENRNANENKMHMDKLNLDWDNTK